MEDVYSNDLAFLSDPFHCCSPDYLTICFVSEYFKRFLSPHSWGYTESDLVSLTLSSGSGHLIRPRGEGDSDDYDDGSNETLRNA